MLQNPPPLPPASCTLTGAMLPHQCRAARPGADKLLSCVANGACRTGTGRAGADKRRKGVADRTGAGARKAGSATTLVADEAKHPIRLNPPDQVESRLTGRMPPTSYNPLE